MRLVMLVRRCFVHTGVVLLLAGSMQSRAVDLTGTLWAATAQREGLDPTLLYAVAADGKLPVPGGRALRGWIDGYDLSLLRPVHADAKVSAAAARRRLNARGRDVIERMAAGPSPRSCATRSTTRSCSP